MAATDRVRTPKADAVALAAQEQARAAAVEAAEEFGVGEHLGYRVEGDRVISHLFSCSHPGYRGWYWSVTVVRASRARHVTVNEVVLLPGPDAVESPAWIPWADRIQPKDVLPGVLMPTPQDDPRLEPGFTGGEEATSTDPAEASQLRAVVAELGLGRERVLSPEGRDEAAQRWLAAEGGPDNEMTSQAPAPCVTCGWFVRLRGSLGTVFGVCANQYSPSDGAVVSVDHGCGGHSDVADDHVAAELPRPLWDTVSWDGEGSLFG